MQATVIETREEQRRGRGRECRSTGRKAGMERRVLMMKDMTTL